VAGVAGAADVTGDTQSAAVTGFMRAEELQFPDRKLCAPSAGTRNTPEGAPNGGSGVSPIARVPTLGGGAGVHGWPFVAGEWEPALDDCGWDGLEYVHD